MTPNVGCESRQLFIDNGPLSLPSPAFPFFVATGGGTKEVTGFEADCNGGWVQMSWNPVVGTAAYNIYRGSISALTSGTYDHDQFSACGVPVPVFADQVCGDRNSYYYLVVTCDEGSYGDASDGTPRPQAGFPCM